VDATGKMRGIKETHAMQTITITTFQSVAVLGKPVDSDGHPSEAKVGRPSYSSSDRNIFSVVPDAAASDGAIITATGYAGTATLTETAQVKEANGILSVITGIAQVVVVHQDAEAAASLEFDFGTPYYSPHAAPHL
jgi:hypothetical protein